MPSSARSTEPGPEPEQNQGQKPRPVVLLVEDDDDARSIYRDMLVFAGFNVLAASNGLVGLQYAEARPPNIVVTDLHMPEMNGIEVARALSANEPAPPIIAVTADSLGTNPGGQWAESRKLFAEVLIKPVNPTHLVRTVREYVSPGGD